MSTGFESAISSFLEKNGVGTAAATAQAREYVPLGVNAQKVVSLRYSLKDEHGVLDLSPMLGFFGIQLFEQLIFKGFIDAHQDIFGL